ncbi:hypothetical protein HPB47_023950 [Ixodes persulcatus]|uniref:Uncharacterized protein n=1 Tax=Ixodes persulcatus TaxID=34615 RepID=A0AC60Q5K6_IXOPE|nr:hypothetical protein HPB47_023950 [Ixodes persulcatus]
MITHAYVRYIEDNEQAVVAIKNIRDFRPRGPEDFKDKAKYNVKWGSDDEYYKARILLLGASEEDVRQKLQTARLRIKKVIESSDYSDEDAMEKENAKAQRKTVKKAGNIDKGDLMKFWSRKKNGCYSGQVDKPGEVEEKLKRAQRQIARLEKELWEKDRELEKLRYLNMKLQESIIEKFESWKGKHASKFPGRPPRPGLCPHRIEVLKVTSRKEVTGRINEKIGDLRKLEKRSADELGLPYPTSESLRLWYTTAEANGVCDWSAIVVLLVCLVLGGKGPYSECRPWVRRLDRVSIWSSSGPPELGFGLVLRELGGVRCTDMRSWRQAPANLDQKFALCCSCYSRQQMAANQEHEFVLGHQEQVFSSFFLGSAVEPQFGVGRLQHRSSAILFSAFKDMVTVGISVPPHVVPAHRDHGTVGPEMVDDGRCPALFLAPLRPSGFRSIQRAKNTPKTPPQRYHG